jgi:perosamine synthetase
MTPQPVLPRHGTTEAPPSNPGIEHYGVTSKTQTRRIQLAKPVFDDEMKEAAIHALQNERFLQGESVYKFEQEFARYCGTKFAVSTASGTSALTLSLIALGITRRECEVVTSPFSFVASANCAIHAGGAVKFADVTFRTGTIDPQKVRSSLNGNVKAIIPVHLYGYPAEMDELLEIASQHKLAIVEDAAQAHGASYRGRMVGSIGNTGCFSFYPAKNMTVAGDGGMVVTNNEETAQCVASLRDCGRIKGSWYEHGRIGFTSRLNTVQAAIGRVQLKRLDAWNEKRRAVARMYDSLLSDIDSIVTPPPENDVFRPVYHLYVIRCRERDRLKARLEQNGIQCGVHYPVPIHLQPIYRELYGHKGGEFPNSETLSGEVLSIPMHPALTTEEVKMVSDSIHKFYERD